SAAINPRQNGAIPQPLASRKFRRILLNRGCIAALIDRAPGCQPPPPFPPPQAGEGRVGAALRAVNQRGIAMIERTLDIATKAGAMETFICHPERGGPFPAVMLLMDAHGIREELRDMARRLGTVGYYVLLPNLYYRAGRDTIYGPTVRENGSAEHTRMRMVRTKMTIPPVMDDVGAILEFIDRAEAARQGPVGAHGYCM